MIVTSVEWKMIDDAFFAVGTGKDTNGAALRDLFALGCYLYLGNRVKY